MNEKAKINLAHAIHAETANIQLQNELIAALRAMVGDGKTTERQALAMARTVLAKLEQK